MHTVHISKTKWLELATNSKVRPNGGQSNKCVITLEREKKKNLYLPHSCPRRPRVFLVSIKNRDLWPRPTPEVCDSRTSRHSAHAPNQIELVLVSNYCAYKAIQNRNVIGPGQKSRFLVLTKRSGDSEDENDITPAKRGGHHHSNDLYVSRQRHRALPGAIETTTGRSYCSVFATDTPHQHHVIQMWQH